VGDVAVGEREGPLEQRLGTFVELDQPDQPRVVLVGQEEEGPVEFGREDRRPLGNRWSKRALNCGKYVP